MERLAPCPASSAHIHLHSAPDPAPFPLGSPCCCSPHSSSPPALPLQGPHRLSLAVSLHSSTPLLCEALTTHRDQASSGQGVEERRDAVSSRDLRRRESGVEKRRNWKAQEEAEGRRGHHNPGVRQQFGSSCARGDLAYYTHHLRFWYCGLKTHSVLYAISYHMSKYTAGGTPSYHPEIPSHSQSKQA